MRYLIILTALFCMKPIETNALHGELVLVEYHHTQYVYKHDDIGMKRLTIKQVEEQIK